MSHSEELLGPLRNVLDNLISFAHERYCDAVRSTSSTADYLRLVAAAEAFQTLAAAQQITRAVTNLDQNLRDVECWSKQVITEEPVVAEDSLELPRSLLMTSLQPPLKHGFWESDTEYALEQGEHRIEITSAGPDQVVVPKRGVVLSVGGGPVVLEPQEWEEIHTVVNWLTSTSAPPVVEEVKEKK